MKFIKPIFTFIFICVAGLLSPQILPAQTIIKSDTSDYDILKRDPGGLSSFHDIGTNISVSIVSSGGFMTEYYRAILQFDISDLTGPVNSARFHVYSGARGGTLFDVDLYGSSLNRDDFIHASNSSSTDEFFNNTGKGYSIIGGTGTFIKTSDPQHEWYTIDITSFINSRITDYLNNPTDSIVVLKLRPDGSYSSGSTQYNFSSGNSSKEPFLSIYEGDTQQEITGTEGWRMLSAPTSNNSYADLLSNVWTQGITTGANTSQGNASVKVYGGAGFTALNDLTATMTPGEGFIAYIYDDDDNDGNPDGFPKTLSVNGTENSGTITPVLNTGGNAWTLVGNPYAFSVDWDAIDKTDLTGTVYVYDHNYGTPTSPDTPAPNVSGSYRVWNGSAGSLTGGRIAAMQGFWVQNSSGTPSPSLSFKESDKTSRGTFYKENSSPVTLQLNAEMDGLTSRTFFSFTENGLIQKDNHDGLKLKPLDFKDYLSLSSQADDELLAINNLPADFESELRIPLDISAYQADASADEWISMGGTVTLSWPEITIPEEWDITVNDFETGAEINLKEQSEYTFSLSGSQQKMKQTSASVIRPIAPAAQKVGKQKTNQRFSLTISKQQTTGIHEIQDQPEEFSLEQNYPNPFNPSTSIQYSVMESGPVTLTVYNIMGQQVETLVNETKSAGTYRVSWNATNMASGMYYYRLEAGNNVLTRKMTLIK